MEEIELIFETTKESMDSSIEHLKKELKKISTGKANPAMLDGLLVDYYGSPTPLNRVANVGVSDSKTLTIQPWEKSMLAPIEQAIFKANMGVTPQNDGEIVRIIIPPLTQDRRKQLVKNAKSLVEDTKVSLRNARRDAISEIKQAVKDGLSEDIGKDKEKEIDEMTKNYGNKSEELFKVKEKDILTI
ncbi:MAG: ribosome recycling factor [Bacteroidota bacterium]